MDKYGYSGYGIVFDRKSSFSFPGGGFGQNLLIFWSRYKFGYSGYGIGFDRKSSFSFPGGGFSQNLLIFGVDISFSADIDNKKKDILVPRKGPTQGLNQHTLTAEKMYSINFTVTKKEILFKFTLQRSKQLIICQ